MSDYEVKNVEAVVVSNDIQVRVFHASSGRCYPLALSQRRLIHSKCSGQSLAEFYRTDQMIGERWRPTSPPPRCSSIVQNSTGGAFRAAPGVRTAFGRSARVREAARPRGW